MTKTKILHEGEDYIDVLHHDEEYQVTGVGATLIKSMLKEQDDNEVEMVREIMSFLSSFASRLGVPIEYLVHDKRKQQNG